MKTVSNSLHQLLSILNDGECHLDTELGERLNMTPAAVQKLIKSLIDYQINIESVYGKGYRLHQPLVMLDSKTILQHANLKPLKPILKIFASIDSTQNYLKPLFASKDKPMLCLAEYQAAGRGSRLGRSWHSPFGANLTLSCLGSIQKDLSELGGLSLVIGLAIIRALQEYGLKEKLQLKWPNDIYCHDKKLAGMLVEVKGETRGVMQVLTGIGLNINMKDAEIDQAWTSLYQLTQTYHNRSEVAGRVIHWIFDYLQEFERHGLKQFLFLWEKYDYLKGQEITVRSGEQTKTGEAVGINAQGELCLKMGDQIYAVGVGDTLVKKV